MIPFHIPVGQHLVLWPYRLSRGLGNVVAYWVAMGPIK